MFQTKVVEKIKTQILCSTTLFENRAIYEKTYKNIVGPSRPRVKIWRMRTECWIRKATNTLSEYAILIAFLVTMVMRPHLNAAYTYFAYIVRSLHHQNNRFGNIYMPLFKSVAKKKKS